MPFDTTKKTPQGPRGAIYPRENLCALRFGLSDLRGCRILPNKVACEVAWREQVFMINESSIGSSEWIHGVRFSV
jgi:hypothetical protein